MVTPMTANNKTPVCYGYGRHSTGKQELTREVQEFKCHEYWQRNLRDKGIQYGGFFYDAATSARTPFSEREQGRLLHAVARPGDHIVVTKLDRPFRSLRDGISHMEQWESRGVVFHSMDLAVDTTTPLGKFFRTILLAVAELEREFARERTSDVIRERRRQGIPHGSACPMGWRIVGSGKSRRYRVDEEERAFCDELAKRRRAGASLEDLAYWSFRQRDLPVKRTLPTRDQVRWALDARRAGYPMVVGYKAFNRAVRSGEIALRSS